MKARILVVDRNVIRAESTRATLNEMGYATSGIAASDVTALRSIEQDRPDLVLIDVDLGVAAK